jgi:HEAT repeat protein
MVVYNIHTVLHDPDPEKRRLAIEQFEATPSPAAVSVIAAALRDADRGVRDAASRSLLAIGGSNAARAIVEYIADENIATRNLASDLLVKLGSVSIPALLPFLSDADEDVRKFAVDILGMIRENVPAASLYPLLHDPDQNVVLAAVEALGNIRQPEAVPHLLRSFDEQPFTRAAVVEALGKIQDPRTSNFLLERFQKEIAQPAPDPLLLFLLLEALGLLGDAAALSVLEATASSTRGKLRNALIHALVAISERTGSNLDWSRFPLSALIEALHDDDPGICISAAKALLTISGTDVTAELIGAMGRNDDLDVLLRSALMQRGQVFQLLPQQMKRAGARGKREMISLLGSLAAQMVERFASKQSMPVDEHTLHEAFDAVAAEWNDAEEETRMAIVETLFRLDGDRAMEFLATIANDPDPWLRVRALELTAAVVDPRMPAFLAQFLEDEDEMVRETAAQILNAKGYSFEQAEEA